MKNKNLFTEAKKYIPGGVNSPVRSFRSVGGNPIFIKKGKGSKLYSSQNKNFIDYCMSWGALILGHSHPKVIKTLHTAIKKGTSFGACTELETRLARLIVSAIPSIEKVRLVNSGTEACMSAVRLARAYTKRDKIIKFEGSYHGHSDYLLVKAGSGALSLGVPTSLGLPKDFVKHTIVLPFNDIQKIKETAHRFKDQIASIIVEPVEANCGVILPDEKFLRALREIATRYKIVLIFDEVITGFRVTYGGAQNFFKITPDLTCLGKIIGGGMPIGAFGGKNKIMKLLAPEGGVYQAGTLSGNPVAVSSGIATLNILKKEKPYGQLKKNTKWLCENIASSAKEYGVPLKVNYLESLFSIFFTSTQSQNRVLFNRFFHGLLNNRVYLSPSGFEANFLSIAHSEKDLKNTIRSIRKVLKEMRDVVCSRRSLEH